MDIGAVLTRAGFAGFGLLPAHELPLIAGKALPKGANTAIIGLFPYYAGDFKGRNVALYAVGPDYHSVIKARLNTAAAELAATHKSARFWPFVDASPVDEVGAAAMAGLGQIGRNGMLIAPKWGQLTFIGCLLTSIKPEEIGARPALNAALPQYPCEGCGRCLVACPTKALGERGVDVSLCRSAISQKKGALTDWEAAQIAAGGLVWGCDRCLLSCPYNSALPPSPIDEFHTALIPVLRAEDIDALSERAYFWRGKDVLRRNLSLITKNKKEGTGHLQNT